mmetsp:Transcript_5465/g.9149  ORF Transcript_5465/g.9149 Transcript_5465/m.9149 type:complete len:190 (+) Transcript_5465:233-802(+)
MNGSADASIRSGQAGREMSSCFPDEHPNATDDCCCYQGCNQAKCSSFTFTHNIVFSDTEHKDSFLVMADWEHGWHNFTFQDNVYFPQGLDSGLPLFNSSHRYPGEGFSSWQSNGKDVGSLFADPLFLAAHGKNFTLRPESPAFGIGFQPIDLSDIGPRQHVKAHHEHIVAKKPWLEDFAAMKLVLLRRS